VNLKHVGVKGEFAQSDEFLQVDVNREIEPPLIDCALLQSAGSIAKGFADIGRRKFDAVFLQRIRQQSQRGFLDGAFTGVGVGGFFIVGLLVFLRPGNARKRSKQDANDEPANFQNVARAVMAIMIKQPASHHPGHAGRNARLAGTHRRPAHGTQIFRKEAASHRPEAPGGRPQAQA
jgi:hypothetical protein